MSLFDEEENESEYRRARKRATYLLGDKDYCSGELYEKLKKNYSDETCEKVISDMIEFGYLDDERYAHKYAEYLIRKKKHGVYKVRFEMKKKGISKELTDSVLAEYESEDYADELCELIRKKYSDKLSEPESLKKVMNALARRGYSFSEIKKAVRAVEQSALDELFYDEENLY